MRCRLITLGVALALVAAVVAGCAQPEVEFGYGRHRDDDGHRVGTRVK